MTKGAIEQQIKQARAELAEMGNPYARPANDWVEAHLRHLAIQRYHALRELIAALGRIHTCTKCKGGGWIEVTGSDYYSDAQGNWLPSERQIRCPRCGGSGREVA